MGSFDDCRSGFKKNLNRAGQSVSLLAGYMNFSQCSTRIDSFYMYNRLNKEQAETIELSMVNSKKSLRDSKSRYSLQLMPNTHTECRNHMLDSLEKKSEKLAKEAKGYLDSMRGKCTGNTYTVLN